MYSRTALLKPLFANLNVSTNSTVMQCKVASFPDLLRSFVFGSDMSAPSIMTIVCIRSLHGRLYMYRDGMDAHVYHTYCDYVYEILL